MIATYPSSTTTQFIDTWHVKDYLGSVRVILDITNDTSAVSHPSLAIIEQNDYLPFGMRVESANMAYDLDNRYRYNGKEEQVIGELDLIDYGARFYDNTFTRWTTPDPLAEKYYSISPYAFCNNNPVNFVDLDGKAIDFIWDIASVGMGIQSFVQNVQSGNVRGAVGDGVGVVIDVFAAAVPFVPGGVGVIRNGAKVVDAIDNATDATKALKAKKPENVSGIVHGNSKLSINAQHASDIIDTETNTVVKTGVSGGKIRKKDNKSYRAEQQVRKWNTEEDTNKYKSIITHKEPEGIGSRDRILEYERQRAQYLREINQLDIKKHITP